ncbi:MAG: hypothetical protein U9Q33_11990 [Campylobacterota bacterium]|nr:hypothetical protein [Campylobacterota bacterium]
MASILSVIALGSGLAKMILSDYSFSFFSKLEAGNSLFDIGVVLFFILILNIIVVFYKLKKTINLLKDR